MNKFVYTLIGTVTAGVLLAGCSSSTDTSTPAASSTPDVSASPTGSPAAMMKPVTIKLNAQKGSGQNGTATFEEVNGQVKVTLAMTGKAYKDAQPAHIHMGTCLKPGDVVYPLTDVVGGNSVTMLNVSMADMKAKGNLLVNIHKSAKESNVYTSCGEIPSATSAMPSASPAAKMMKGTVMPKTAPKY